MLVVYILNSCSRVATSGRSNDISESNLPGRRSAGSIASTLFVAPIKMTLPKLEIPSINASNVDTTEALWLVLDPDWRVGANPSNSSKNMILGAV